MIVTMGGKTAIDSTVAAISDVQQQKVAAKAARNRVIMMSAQK